MRDYLLLVQKSFCVDDCLSDANSVTEVIELQRQLQTCSLNVDLLLVMQIGITIAHLMIKA